MEFNGTSEQSNEWIEVAFVKQEHRLIRILQNFLLYKNQPGPYRQAATYALAWKIATSVLPAIAFGTVALTAVFGLLVAIKANRLIENQNTIIEKQAEFDAASFTKNVREILMEQKLNGDEIRHFSSDRKSIIRADKCTLSFSNNLQRSVKPLPNPSTLASLGEFAENEHLRDRLIKSLTHLLNDRDGSVALGSLVMLERLGVHVGPLEMTINNIVLPEKFNIAAPLGLTFKDSLITEIECQECSKITYQGSIIKYVSENKTEVIDSVISDVYQTKLVKSSRSLFEIDFASIGQIEEDYQSVILDNYKTGWSNRDKIYNYFYVTNWKPWHGNSSEIIYDFLSEEEYRKHAPNQETYLLDEPKCEDLKELCKMNNFYACSYISE